MSQLETSGVAIENAVPNSPEGYIFHSRALFRRGDQAGAEADLKKAIAVAPRSSIGYSHLGDSRTAQKRYEEAEKAYAQALDRDPSAVDPLTGLVKVDLERKQPAKALRLVQDQIGRAPESSKQYLLLG
jgi:tetratricopeptide (TPR) repeat protein